MLSLVYENPWTTVFLLIVALPVLLVHCAASKHNKPDSNRHPECRFFYVFFPYFLPFLALHALLHRIACVFLPRHV